MPPPTSRCAPEGEGGRGERGARRQIARLPRERRQLGGSPARPSHGSRHGSGRERDVPPPPPPRRQLLKSAGAAADPAAAGGDEEEAAAAAERVRAALGPGCEGLFGVLVELVLREDAVY